MGDFQVLEGYVRAENFGATGAAYGVAVTAASGAFGAWATLVDPVPNSCFGYIALLSNPSGADKYVVEFGGPPRLAFDQLGTLMFQTPRAAQGSVAIFLPIGIKAGSALMARAMRNGGGPNQTIAAAAILLPRGWGGLPSYGRAREYGLLGGPSGRVVDPGATANTKGAWVALIGITDRPIRYLVLMAGLRANTAAASFRWTVDLGVGAAGAEQVVIPDWVLASNVTSDDLGPTMLGLPLSIKEGSRLAVRAKCSGTDATDRLIEVAALGIH